MMRELRDVAIDPTTGVPAPHALCGPQGRKSTEKPPAISKRGQRTVTVNMKESPLMWLRARGMISDRHYEAGERLRADYERASIAPSVTMSWNAVRGQGHGQANALDATAAQIAAKQRFSNAIEALGPGLKDIAWRTLCANEALPSSEKALGWPARSGRLVLTLALDHLANHYGLPK